MQKKGLFSLANLDLLDIVNIVVIVGLFGTFVAEIGRNLNVLGIVFNDGFGNLK